MLTLNYNSASAVQLKLTADVANNIGNRKRGLKFLIVIICGIALDGVPGVLVILFQYEALEIVAVGTILFVTINWIALAIFSISGAEPYAITAIRYGLMHESSAS